MGLRREELAALSGISTTWLTWIEQGRTVSMSASTVSRLADSLRLSNAERAYLFELAGERDLKKADLTIEPSLVRVMSETVTKIQTPAYVLDHAWDAVAWNPAAAKLFTGWLHKTSLERNLLKFMFLAPEAREFIVDWPDRAQRLVAEFRSDCRELMEDPKITDLIGVLRQSSNEFDRFWRAQNVLEREGGERTFCHPKRGKVTMQQLTFRMSQLSTLKLVILLCTR